MIRFALCIRSGDGFEQMKLYPICGYNNGIQIVRENEQGDAEVTRFEIYGNHGEEMRNPDRYDGAIMVEAQIDEYGVKIPTIPIEYML